MTGRVGTGSWVMFVDAAGAVREGRAISDPESLFGGQSVIWVDAVQDDGSLEATPVPVNEVRLVERPPVHDASVTTPPSQTPAADRPTGPGRSKRIGERSVAGQWPAEVELDAGWLRRHARYPVILTDLSMTGVGFTGRLPQQVRRGTTVRLELHGLAVPMRIRRLADDTDPASYGAEMVRPGREILEEIHRLMTR